MPKKQSTKKRAQVKDLPKKGKKLSKGDMKKVKGGFTTNITNEVRGSKVLSTNVYEREAEADFKR